MSQHTHRATAEDHTPEAIRKRLESENRDSLLGDGVLGAIDGIVTTFAVVAGAVGAGFSQTVIIVLGFANLLADGFSMAVSNYQATRSEQQQRDRALHHEYEHIERVPEGEREEVRQIYRLKGFEGRALEHIVETITSDKDLWAQTMVTEELGYAGSGPRPIAASTATFAAFAVAGLVPLLPFLVPVAGHTAVTASIALAGASFLAVGILKAPYVAQPRWRSGLETFLMGGIAAVLAWGVGALLRQVFDIGMA